MFFQSDINTFYQNKVKLMKTTTLSYDSPEVQVVEIKTEGILCASGEGILSGNDFELYEEDDSWL